MSDNRRTHDGFELGSRKNWSAPALKKIGIEEITSASKNSGTHYDTSYGTMHSNS